MKKYTIEEAKELPIKFLILLINKAKKHLKQDPILKKICKDYNVSTEVIDHIPTCFGELDVSAKTARGVVILNYKLLCDGDFLKDYSYLIHEYCHVLQQCFGDKATRNSDDGNYLENPAEQEAFQKQIEYIAKEFGEPEAEDYVENLLDHHEVKNPDRDDLKDELMSEV